MKTRLTLILLGIGFWLVPFICGIFGYTNLNVAKIFLGIGAVFVLVAIFYHDDEKEEERRETSDKETIEEDRKTRD